MKCSRNFLSAIFFIGFLFAPFTIAQEKRELVLKHSDELEVLLENGRYITHVLGNVIFETETGTIHCDSAIWDRGRATRLSGHVRFNDRDFLIISDSLFYDLRTQQATALGKKVELWSYVDSIYAISTHAFFDRQNNYLKMFNRPILYLQYPDSANMIKVVADTIEYVSTTRRSDAYGNVEITSKDLTAASGQAHFDNEQGTLELTIEPTAVRRNSKISGEIIKVAFAKNDIESIDVIDAAHAEFNEPVTGDTTYIDQSILKGREIHFSFLQGELESVICYNQAYSWYYPSSQGDTMYQENSVSGDTIKFLAKEERLTEVQVIGGAIGQYLSAPVSAREPGSGVLIDTVNYKGQFINYSLDDSLIRLEQAADIKSGTVSLNAHQVKFDTRIRIIEAYSAQGAIDSGLAHESPFEFQPNLFPVLLSDKDDKILGDYLVYSIDSKKGRIFQSKTSYNDGHYYGEKLYREKPHIFYIDDGRYTSCDADAPHFHFHSKNLKLIENDKLIARPVVFYLGRIPLFALPYYIFPLERGRHSGLLPFNFGSFTQGDRYIKNVGYYWAASQFWDIQSSLDYIERQRTITLNTRVNFSKRYVLNGFFAGSYTRATSYDRTKAAENKSTRWISSAAYNHTFSPSFYVRGFADFRSDATYFDDYSINREDRLNRDAKSKVSFSKRFASGIAASGDISHTENFDLGSRSNLLPSLSVSFPTIWPFGSKSTNQTGQTTQKWFHGFTFRYSPSFVNSSSRITIDSTGQRSRKKFWRIEHNPGIGLPSVSLFKYFKLIPSFRYSETWIRVIQTDQSIAASIEPTIYRTYSYSGSVSARTDLYGTFYPNVFGILGLRHTISPVISYSYSPDINKHPNVRSYVGGGAGSTKSQSIGVGIQHVFQAKYRKGEIEKSIDLISVNSGFSYNFEADTRKYSALSTSFQSSAIPRITFNGRMTHSLYKPGTDEVDFWSPSLENFDFNASFSFSGKSFIFDDPADRGITRGADSPEELFQSRGGLPTYMSAAQGWRFSASYGYSESGSDQSFRKFSFFRFNLNFNLTPTTSFNYSHDYDIDDNKTIHNSVRIVRQLHCWSGSLYWVPIGSNRGFGFQLFVTAIPDIKIDNNHDSYLRAFQQ